MDHESTAARRGILSGCMRAPALALLLFLGLFEAHAALSGRPLVTRIVPDLSSYPQHFALVRGADGLLFLATAGGVAIHDGETWELVPLPNGQPARSLAMVGSTVAVGGYDEAGFLRPTAEGRHRFESVLDRLPPGDSANLWEVRQVLAYGDEVHFLSQATLLSVVVADGSARRRDSSESFGAIAAIDDTLLLAGDGQLFAGAGDGAWQAVATLPDGFEAADAVTLADRVIFRGRDDRFLAWDGSALNRMELVSASGERAPFIAMAAVGTDWVALGTPTGELVLENLASGEVRRHSLIDDRIDDLHRDSQGGLWAMSHSELMVLEWPPRWETWDREDGMLGTVNRVLEVDGHTLVASSAGVLSADDSGRFELLDWTPTEAWDLLPWSGGGWILAESPRLSHVSPEGDVREIGSGHTPRVLLADGARVWVGTNDGVLRLTAGEDGLPAITGFWAWETPLLVRSLALDARGALWIGTLSAGVLRLDPDGGKPTRVVLPGSEAGEPGAAAVSRVGDEVWLAAADRRFAWRGEVLVPLDRPELDSLGGLDFTVRLARQADGTRWLSTFRGVLREGPDGWHPVLLDGFRRGAFNYLGPSADGGMWVGGTGALYRYRAASGPSLERARQTLLRRVTVDTSEGRSAVAFAGNIGATDSGTIPGTRPDVSIRFALPIFQGPLRATYRTRLLGHSDRWSPWRPEPRKTFTSLAPGTYRFEVQARSGTGVVAAPATWSFVVAPGFFETLPGRALLVLSIAVIGFALAMGVTRVRTARLRESNIRLDRIVRERTEALEVANSKLRRLAERDGLTGLANRRMFDASVRDRWACRAEAEFALLLLDADRFKRYNDTHGHLAGDELLRNIATVLEDVAGRYHAFAARYGGEEFAVLVELDDGEELEPVAETLRQEIAERTAATVSIGGAMAGGQASLDALVDSADQALYRAKEGGRNRVALA